jgi:hypothetical protein
MQFEFHIYRADDSGVFLHSEPEIETARLNGDTAARAKAGRLAKRHNGPVDLAFAGGADWSERYITTASPSEFHASGYRFERLA